MQDKRSKYQQNTDNFLVVKYDNDSNDFEYEFTAFEMAINHTSKFKSLIHFIFLYSITLCYLILFFSSIDLILYNRSYGGDGNHHFNLFHQKIQFSK